ncbi:MAG: tRNA-(ms[2]io[6]A)-hydroxylase [Pseudomonadota bacterium]
MRPDKQPVLNFLQVRTPDAWFAEATRQLPLLLVDHANCEKKAASTALALMYRYVGQTELLHAMSRLAREELRHFEQVLDLMQAENVEYTQINAARYAQSLHELVRKEEPYRLVDQLVLGAVVEARSCERFIGLVDVLPEGIAGLYRQLVDSEARHFMEYLRLARAVDDAEVGARTEVFLARDAELVCAIDPQFRFHSGVPG